MYLPYKLGGIVVLVEIGLIATLTLTWSSGEFSVSGTSVLVSGGRLLSLVLVVLAWTGTDLVVREHSATHSEQSDSVASHCILPALLIAGAPTLLAQVQNSQTQIAGLTATGALLSLLVAFECFQLSWTGWSQDAVRRLLQLTAYLVAMLACVAVRVSDAPALTSLLAVACTGALVAFRVLGASGVADSKAPTVAGGAARVAAKVVLHRWSRALAVGFGLGMLAWPLLRWVASPVSFAAALTVALYVLVETLRHFLSGQLTQHLALEYLFVGLLALVMILSRAH